MNFLADEGVDKQIVMRLRAEGHSVSYLAEMAPGIPVVASAIADHIAKMSRAFAVIELGRVRVRRSSTTGN